MTTIDYIFQSFITIVLICFVLSLEYSLGFKPNMVLSLSQGALCGIIGVVIYDKLMRN